MSMDPEASEPVYGPKECGSCRLWRAILEDARGPIGPCRLRVRGGDFPGTAPICERYLGRDVALPSAPSVVARRTRAAQPVLVRTGGAQVVASVSVHDPRPAA